MQKAMWGRRYIWAQQQSGDVIGLILAGGEAIPVMVSPTLLLSRPKEIEAGFEWFEVTEVFTTVPPQQIEAAMRALNGFPGMQPIDLDGFLEGLDRGRPSRAAQRRAADAVIRQIERKLAKASYDELMEKYGYGTLVVGLPLWFAVPPTDLLRAKNALDEFDTRTKLGLEVIQRRKLNRSDCPFKQVVVLWETTLEAMQGWEKRRSRAYDEIAYSALGNPIPISACAKLLEISPQSIRLHAMVKVQKKQPSIAPLPETAQKVQELLREQHREYRGLREQLRRRVALIYVKMFLVRGSSAV